jgi:hypothetical protein
LADQLAKKLIGQELDWTKVPDFLLIQLDEIPVD